MDKTCKKCKEIKSINEYHKDSQGKYGCKATCKICIAEFQKKYWVNNKEHKQILRKEWGLNNKEKLRNNQNKYYKNNKEKVKEYLSNNKEKIVAYRKEYTKTYSKNRKLVDPLFKLRCSISTLINISIKGKGYTKKSKTSEYLGCTFIEFKQHLQKQFTKGMTWENKGEWHMDHIYPVSLAKDEEHLIKLNHYTNFQPLWALDNIKKGNKII